MTSFSGWKLNSAKSFEGEKSGQESEIGFRGSRFTVDSGGKIYLLDYNNEKTDHHNSVEYVIQLRKVLSHLTENWSGRFRIRGNGDTYCKYDAITYYVGNTIFDDRENFSGYRMNQTIAPNSVPKKYIRLWEGSHNSGQIGERWTIPDKSFAHRKNRIGNVGNKIAKGEWVSASDPAGVVMGKHLARTLEATIGDELLLLSQATDGSMANDLYTVKGILKTVGDATDRTGVYMNANSFREFMSFPEGAHQIVLRLPKGMDKEKAKAAVVEMVSKTTTVLTWLELYPTMATMLQSTEGMIYILYFM